MAALPNYDSSDSGGEEWAGTSPADGVRRCKVKPVAMARQANTLLSCIASPVCTVILVCGVCTCVQQISRSPCIHASLPGIY